MFTSHQATNRQSGLSEHLRRESKHFRLSGSLACLPPQRRDPAEDLWTPVGDAYCAIDGVFQCAASDGLSRSTQVAFFELNTLSALMKRLATLHRDL
jgi:hypothetical protein